MHPLAIYFLLFPLVAQANLSKCADAKGNITYTNTSCAKMGLKEVALIPPPPPPAGLPQARAAEAAKPSAEAPAKPGNSTALRLTRASQAADEPCARLDRAMGRILDEMDAGRRQGRTDPNAGLDENLKKLQAEKNRLGCF